MNPDWRKVKLSEEESGLIWLELSQDDDDVSVRCSCYFTDLVNIYSEHLNKTQIEARFLEQNSGIETEDYREFLTNVKTTLSVSKTSSNTSIYLTKESCKISIDWTSEGIDFKWFFQTNVGPSEMFYKLMSYPLISVIQQLRRDKETLLAVVRDKDLEIEDYENNGSRLSLKKLKTGKFDPDVLKTPDDGEKIDTVNIVADPDTWDVLTVKDLTVKKLETEIIKESPKRKNTISEPQSAHSEEESICRKKIKLEKPNLSKIAQNSSRFNKPKKAKF